MPDINALFDAARLAQACAHAPYSGFHVGAAILGRNGGIFSGCNVENAAYPVGSCAEAGAIAAMVLAGETRLAAIAIVGSGAEDCFPCGACRQRIREFSDASTRIYVGSAASRRQQGFTIDELLPNAFGPDNLPRT